MADAPATSWLVARVVLGHYGGIDGVVGPNTLVEGVRCEHYESLLHTGVATPVRRAWSLTDAPPLLASAHAEARGSVVLDGSVRIVSECCAELCGPPMMPYSAAFQLLVRRREQLTPEQAACAASLGDTYDEHRVEWPVAADSTPSSSSPIHHFRWVLLMYRRRAARFGGHHVAIHAVADAASLTLPVERCTALADALRDTDVWQHVLSDVVEPLLRRMAAAAASGGRLDMVPASRLGSLWPFQRRVTDPAARLAWLRACNVPEEVICNQAPLPPALPVAAPVTRCMLRAGGSGAYAAAFGVPRRHAQPTYHFYVALLPDERACVLDCSGAVFVPAHPALDALCEHARARGVCLLKCWFGSWQETLTVFDVLMWHGQRCSPRYAERRTALRELARVIEHRVGAPHLVTMAEHCGAPPWPIGGGADATEVYLVPHDPARGYASLHVGADGALGQHTLQAVPLFDGATGELLLLFGGGGGGGALMPLIDGARLGAQRDDVMWGVARMHAELAAHPEAAAGGRVVARVHWDASQDIYVVDALVISADVSTAAAALRTVELSSTASVGVERLTRLIVPAVGDGGNP